jgi:Spy/CpxP family protein refolding chaperone
MNRTLSIVGAAVIALVGAVAVSQAQTPQNPPASGEPRGGRPEFGCGPGRGMDGRGPAFQQGRGQRPPQGAAVGRGARGGRQGAMGRPGGPGRGGPGRGGPGHALCGLDLTNEQQARIAAIHEKAREDVEAVLTPEQLEKLRARRDGR